MRGKVPLRVRILSALTTEPDWDSITPEQIIEVREAQAYKRRSALGRLVTGKPDQRARITTHTLDLPQRRVDVRVYRPEREDSALPLIIAFHGGGPGAHPSRQAGPAGGPGPGLRRPLAAGWASTRR
ncbi:hypothetical protein ABZ552_21360 [Nocardia sp. NPDC019219]|uniref:hypothetical protein n=1 Tax=Nocardia sp. NPDC019219 TaxID=3154590 RepID=UPI0033F2E42F